MPIKGSDDVGNFYRSHTELLERQASQRDAYYKANAEWWDNGGYGGATDNEAMVGDTDGLEDGEEGLAFLDKLLDANATTCTKTNDPNRMKRLVAVDVGAGVGRITKCILLKRYDKIRLVEGNEAYSKRSRVYLGHKRATRCSFTQCYLQDLNSNDLGTKPVDLVWVQWTLQYLTDVDVVKCLKTLVVGLRPVVGVLVVKENRPFGTAREDRFQMDTPDGVSRRYDITRPDAHHRWLFQKAGLVVDFTERGTETNTYALRKE